MTTLSYAAVRRCRRRRDAAVDFIINIACAVNIDIDVDRTVNMTVNIDINVNPEINTDIDIDIDACMIDVAVKLDSSRTSAVHTAMQPHGHAGRSTSSAS